MCIRDRLSSLLPVCVYEPRTLLDRLAELYAYVPALLQPIIDIQDPLEKMKSVMTWVIASMHLGISQYMPFTPTLGETLQGKLKDVEVCAEQISQSPLISAFMLMGKDICINATHRMQAYAYPNSVEAVLYGKKVVQVFGVCPATYYITNPLIEVKGMAFGKRIFKYSGQIIIEDTVNELYGVIVINPVKKGLFANLFGDKKHRADYIRGFITKERRVLEEPERVIYKESGHLSVCEGHWIDSLFFDGKVVWSVDAIQPEELKRPKNKMLSDSTLRLDVQALKRGDEKEAQRIRGLFNSVQREDRKLRRRGVMLKK
eukprot:TRINITY_DN6466_c0_g7_i1.p1 TRINITY_DN6466_c0_g7~~TRINITY_DN6466_c0_g7_i1.p1  ORF type:complete len:316 (+),score=34.85 TRINITY_DN6466_c0_g7_i1:83-1030(+)